MLLASQFCSSCIWQVLGEVVGVSVGILRNLYPHRRVLRVTASVAACVLLLVLGVWSRQLNYAASRQAYFYLDIAGCFLCFFYAVNAMLRFPTTNDPLSLILPFRFFLSA